MKLDIFKKPITYLPLLAAVLPAVGMAQEAGEAVAAAAALSEDAIKAIATAAAQEAMAAAQAAAAEAEGPTAMDGLFTANNVWMMLAAGLVFIMHLGFATLESGLTQSKNTVNILYKNFFIICMGILSYAIVGFNLMYPGDFNGFFGFAGFGLESFATADHSPDYAGAGYPYFTDFLFQAMFAATAATIISGAVAERIKLGSFMLAVTIYVTVIYPIAGSWKWGGGWLDGMGFYDFAGSTLVHSVGGWGALVAAILLGARKGKYTDAGVKPIPGHSMPLAMIGVMLLWLGWFGFNGGSVLSADPTLTSYTLVATCLAAAAGGLASGFWSQIRFKKPDLTMGLNGILAGLVGITAGADSLTLIGTLLTGLIAGVLVVESVVFIDTKLKIDDPVGAISVHLVCGIWGTLAVGIFSMNPDHSLMVQAIGVVAIGVFSLVGSLLIFGLVKAVMGLRVSEEEELGGLDAGEHGQHAYPDFATVSKMG